MAGVAMMSWAEATLAFILTDIADGGAEHIARTVSILKER